MYLGTKCLVREAGSFMKIARQAKILEIIEHNDIETQEDLAQMLKAEGFNVTQATISRDIREMKLPK